MLELRFIGLVEVLLDGQPVRFARRSSLALLIYLAMSNKPHSRESLATLLDGDSTEEHARKRLSNALADLRQQLGDYVQATRHTVAFAQHKTYRLDVADFRHGLARALASNSVEDLARALKCYRDEFLSGLALFGAPDFDEWMSAVREELRQQYLLGLRSAVDSSIRRAEWSAGITAARRLLREEPWLEEVHCQLMLMLARSGQRQAAIDQYAACSRALREELGVEPQSETAALFNRLRGALTRPRHNLPSPATRFVGRQAELRSLSTLLCGTDYRETTITGLGGSGKSRLAMEVGRAFAVADQHLAEQPFPDGVVFVSLAEVTAPGDLSVGTRQAAVEAIFAAVGCALGLPPLRASSRRDQVLDQLHSKQMLLILDNMDHLLPGRAAVADLLSYAPHVKVVATSRAPLHILGERVLPMDGLTLPADEADLDSAAASALFLAEARRVDVGYQVCREDGPALLDLCRAFGGLPLALILAARWAPVLTCRQMLAELSNGVEVLATHESDLPERQRSLACILESTLAGLQSSDRVLVRELALDPRVVCAPHRGAKLDYLTRVRSLREQALVSFDSSRGTVQLHPLLRRYVVREEYWCRSPVEGDATGKVLASTA